MLTNKNLASPLPFSIVTLPLWMGGFILLVQSLTNAEAAGRFFGSSDRPNIGFTGPLALGSAVILLLSASLASFLHGAVRSRFSSDPSPLKRALCLLTLATTGALTLAGTFIMILGPAALSMMEAGLWQSR